MKQFLGGLAFLILVISCERNHEPVVSQINYEPEQTSAGAIIELKVDASDEDGDLLDYSWNSSLGEFLSDTKLKEVSLKVPSDGEGKTVVISVIVTDGEFEVIREANFELLAPLRGSVAGHIFYQNTEVPIQGAIIRVAEKESTSDQDGYFFINDVVAGKDSLHVSKPDYSTKSRSISITQDKTLDLTIELLSITHSTKAFGIVSDQDGEAVEFAEVILLNPDGTESRLEALTDENGLYRISYIPHGFRTLLVRKEANDSERFDDLRKYIEFTELEQGVNLFIKKEILIGEFTDPRDNQLYSFRKMGDYTWMTENMAYLPEVSPPESFSETEAHYYVYGYNGNDASQAKSTNNYLQYGVLYNWEAARKACPPGWHLPGNWEYNSLERLLGDQAGYKMKSQSGWFDLGNGDNSSGLNVIPGGAYKAPDGFDWLSKTAYLQTASIDDQNKVNLFTLTYNSESLNPGLGSKMNGFSVRCVR